MALNKYPTILAIAIGDGAAIPTTTTRTSMLPASAKRTLAADFFDTPGKAIAVEAWGRISCPVTSPGTARFDVAFGANLVMDGLAINLNIVAKVDVPWHLYMQGECRAPGAAAVLQWQGYWESEAVVGSPLPTVGGSGRVLLPYATAPGVGAAFDSGTSQLVDCFYKQSVATAGTNLQLHKYLLTALN